MRRATHLDDARKNHPYQSRLKQIGILIQTLEYRRVVSDMVEVYKHLRLKYHSNIHHPSSKNCYKKFSKQLKLIVKNV